jgi:coenzyme F420-reducing hydrogenase delta subunit
MRGELMALISELSTLKPRLETLSTYSDEGRRVASRIEYLERRIRELELEKIRNEGQGELF